ncbi:MAG: hypothetical protein WC196_04825 [Bacilli bacterium]
MIKITTEVMKNAVDSNEKTREELEVEQLKTLLGSDFDRLKIVKKTDKGLEMRSYKDNSDLRCWAYITEYKLRKVRKS